MFKRLELYSRWVPLIKETDNFILVIETFNTAINAQVKLLSSSVTC